MSQDKIDIKDVTPKTYNPKPIKETGGIGLTQVIASMYAKAKGLTRNYVVTVVGSYYFSSL
ncbi:type cbb3 cytochrome oxidase biogenesis protein CcoG [Vibrio sp. JCM 18904]|nr:type cbb3 cytochrome oxidase biogenesis protein CcoG [Vibrio sp. JCM 18904]